MKSKKTLIMIFILLSINVVHGGNYTCINNETLEIRTTFNFTEDSTVTQYEHLETVVCEWGCDNATHSCSPNPIKSDITILVIIILVGALLFVVFPKITR